MDLLASLVLLAIWLVVTGIVIGVLVWAVTHVWPQAPPIVGRGLMVLGVLIALLPGARVSRRPVAAAAGAAMMPAPSELRRIVQDATLFELAALAEAIAEECHARGLPDAADALRQVTRELLGRAQRARPAS